MQKIIFSLLLILSVSSYGSENTYKCVSKTNYRLFTDSDNNVIYLTLNFYGDTIYAHLEQNRSELPLYLNFLSQNHARINYTQAAKLAGATPGMGAYFSDSLLENSSYGKLSLYNNHYIQVYYCKIFID